MKILRFEAENVKKLSVVEITPKGGLVEIAGRNGQGKTSVLDSILWAIGGERGIQWSPIRNGAEEGHVTLDLGGDDGVTKFRVTRTFRRKKEDDAYTTSLRVENEEGFRATGAQTTLNTFIGSLSFDPLAFMRDKPKDQVKHLQGLVDFDFAATAEKRRGAFEKRTEVGREIREKTAQAAAIIVPDDTPSEAIDASDVRAGIEQNSTAWQTYNAEAAQRTNLASAAEAARTRAAELRQQADAAEAEAKSIDADLASRPPLVEPSSSAELQARLDAIATTNANVMKRRDREALQREVDEKEAEVSALTAAIEGFDRQVREAVAKAELPIPGLALTDEYVTYNGIPLEQASDAEQLRVSAAIAIAQAKRLRVMRIRDGSLLDVDALTALAEIAKENDMQIWLERVGDGTTKDAIILEDGQVRGASIKEEAA